MPRGPDPSPVEAQASSKVLPPASIFVTVFAPEFAVYTLPAESMAMPDGPSPVEANTVATPLGVILVTVSAPEFAV